ncbi:MAG: hypothetical protein EXS32_05065 [Opitutus sp.]|nr:hypothetical protein [Opitutus sp.]
MKIRILLLTLICAVATVPGVRAQEGKAKSADQDEQTELGAKMEKVGAAFRKLRGSAADATKNADSLKQIAIIRENMTAALKFDPAMKADKPAADQAKFVAAYQTKLKEEIAVVEKVEAALKAGNNEEAAKLVAQLGQDQKDAHKQFKKGAPKKQ